MNKTKTMSRKAAIALLTEANIEVGGNRPWDITVHDQQFFQRVLNEGALGLGESYMDGWWDCDRIDQFIARLLQADLVSKAHHHKKFLLYLACSKIINFQSRHYAPIVGKVHYDLDTELYSHMLDSEMNYSCAYWKTTDSLEKAQAAKLDLCCRKLGLEPGMRLLDIGCGWGAMARHAARHYGAEVVGITISRNQVSWAQEKCSGLPVEIRYQDYRDVTEKFDRVVSIGMFEHVGCKNYGSYMQAVDKALNPDGIFLLHTIGVSTNKHGVDPWVIKYIFPHAMLPTMKEVSTVFSESFVMQDWHNLGTNYIKTLLAWHQNFNNNWNLLSIRHDERFRRMWNYFLLYFAGGFSAQHIQIWQILWAKKGSETPCRYVRF